MLYLGYAALNQGMAGTSLVLDHLELSKEERKAELVKARNKAAETTGQWCYGSGLSQWQLYFVDYLLLADEQHDFAVLRRAMHSDTLLPAQLQTALTDHFQWEVFKDEKKFELRTVSRGAVEHWLARDNAIDNSDRERRNGFGNLALIDPSSNSSLGKLNALDKAKAVRKMSNPSRNLWWLAVFTLGLDGRDLFTSDWVEPLSAMWGRFLGDEHFEGW